MVHGIGGTDMSAWDSTALDTCAETRRLVESGEAHASESVLPRHLGASLKPSRGSRPALHELKLDRFDWSVTVGVDFGGECLAT